MSDNINILCVIDFGSSLTKWAIMDFENSEPLKYGIINNRDHKAFWCDVLHLFDKIDFLVKKSKINDKYILCFSISGDINHKLPSTVLKCDEMKSLMSGLFFTPFNFQDCLKHSSTDIHSVYTVNDSIATALGVSRFCSGFPVLLVVLGNSPKITIITKSNENSYLIHLTNFHLATIYIEGFLGYSYALNDPSCLQGSALSFLSAEKKCVRIGRALASVLKLYYEEFSDFPGYISIHGGNSIGLDQKLIRKSFLRYIRSNSSEYFTNATRSIVDDDKFCQFLPIPRSYDEVSRNQFAGVCEYFRLCKDNASVEIKTIKFCPYWFQIFTDE